MIVLNTIAAFSYKQNLIFINNNGVTSLDMTKYVSHVRILIKNNVICIIKVQLTLQIAFKDAPFASDSSINSMEPCFAAR